MIAGRRTTTWEQYGGKFERFIDYCTNVQASVGLPPLSFLPALPSTVLGYLGYLSEEGRVHAASLQPYLSAINAAHADCGLDKPALGHLVGQARKGFGELEGDAHPDRHLRKPVPSQVIWDIMLAGLAAPEGDLLTLRASTCVVLQFMFFNRGDTGHRAIWSDICLDQYGLHLRERTKSLPRIEPATLTIPWPASCVETSPHALFQRYRSAMQAYSPTPDSLLWQLPSERGRPLRENQVSIWLADMLTAVHAQPPPGVLWSMHSLRSGGATAALAIGADIATIARWGLWRSLASVDAYLNPLERMSHASAVFFQHLLKPSAAAVERLLTSLTDNTTATAGSS